MFQNYPAQGQNGKSTPETGNFLDIYISWGYPGFRVEDLGLGLGPYQVQAGQRALREARTGLTNNTGWQAFDLGFKHVGTTHFGYGSVANLRGRVG